MAEQELSLDDGLQGIGEREQHVRKVTTNSSAPENHDVHHYEKPVFPDYPPKLNSDDQESNQDDTSNQFFMSEPSMSEDGDSQSKVWDHHLLEDELESGLLIDHTGQSGRLSSSDEELLYSSVENGVKNSRQNKNTHELTSAKRRQLHEQQSYLIPDEGRQREGQHRICTPQLSPGNTSLSSWDASPAVQQKVFLQFVMPENKYEKQARRQRQQQLQLQQQRTTVLTHKAQTDHFDSINHGNRETFNSTQVEKDRTSMNDGLSVPEIHSNGEGHADTAHMNGRNFQRNLFLPEVATHKQSEAFRDRCNDNYLRRYSIPRSETKNTMSNEHESARRGNIGIPSNVNSQTSNCNESIVKILPSSETWDTPSHFLNSYSCLEGQHSADDEKTAERPRRVRTNKPLGHKRTQSGDAAAAKLAIGGNDWRGMGDDKIPFPVQEGDDEEEQMLFTDFLVKHHSPRFIPSTQTDRSPMQKYENIPLLQNPTTTRLGNQSPPLPPSGLPPMPDREHESPSWESQTKESIDCRQSWMHQMQQVHSSVLLHEFQGSLHSLEESHDEVLDEGSCTTSGASYDGYDDDDDDYDDDEHVDDQNDSLSIIQNGQKLDVIPDGTSCFNPKRASGQCGTGSAILSPVYLQSSPFQNLGKKSAEKMPRAAFLPSFHDENTNYSTYICPRCNTRQREFFTMENASGKFGGAGNYLALYFFVYVICSLFIFGLEEGWMPLDW